MAQIDVKKLAERIRANPNVTGEELAKALETAAEEAVQKMDDAPSGAELASVKNDLLSIFRAELKPLLQRVDELASQIKKSSGDEEQKCPHCERLYDTQKMLEEHLTLKHQDKVEEAKKAAAGNGSTQNAEVDLKKIGASIAQGFEEEFSKRAKTQTEGLVNLDTSAIQDFEKIADPKAAEETILKAVAEGKLNDDQALKMITGSD